MSQLLPVVVLNYYPEAVSCRLAALLNSGSFFEEQNVLYQLVLSFSKTILFSFHLPSDDEDRDLQGERPGDYGKRHQAIDVL